MMMEIVGGSSVPDLISGIAQNFNMLDSVMVNPAMTAADGVIRAFDQITWPLMFGGVPLPNFDARPLPLMFGGATSGLTETPVGTVITINMNGMLGADDPQTRAAVRDMISQALMPGMRSTRLLGTA